MYAGPRSSHVSTVSEFALLGWRVTDVLFQALLLLTLMWMTLIVAHGVALTIGGSQSHTHAYGTCSGLMLPC